jgi:hypothetical protein
VISVVSDTRQLSVRLPGVRHSVCPTVSVLSEYCLRASACHLSQNCRIHSLDAVVVTVEPGDTLH